MTKTLKPFAYFACDPHTLKPVWSEDCVCQDDVYSEDETGTIGRAIVFADDAEAYADARVRVAIEADRQRRHLKELAQLDAEWISLQRMKEAYETDRQQRGEPVGYIDKYEMESLTRNGVSVTVYPSENIETIPVYTSPQSAAPSQEPVAWQPIETAPKDRPIIAYCNHEADPHHTDGPGGRLTLYAAHYEGLSHCETGIHIVEWGGAWDDRTYEDSSGGFMPDWWFVAGSGFEVAANPTHWIPLPAFPNTAPQSAEPVGEVAGTYKGAYSVGNVFFPKDGPLPSGTKLYTAPQPTETRNDGFDKWLENPYTKVLEKSITEDYVPQPTAPAQEPSDELRILSDRAYCQYIDQMSRPENKGVDYKLENNKFGAFELAAHNKAHEYLGRHRAFSEALALLAQPSAAAPKFGEEE